MAAALELLRPVADEIVLAVDASVDPALMGEYVALCDRFYRVEYNQFERQLGWLLGLCEGDWILHLDGDEVPSEAFARRLPSLLDRSDVRELRIRRTWLWPDASHALTDAPWATDFQNRLLRNDGTLRTGGVQHTHVVPALPAAYVDEPIYHLALALDGIAERRDRVVRYEASRPRLVADGGGRLNEAFYLPEERPVAPAVGPVAHEDLARLLAALAATALPSGVASGVSDVPLVEAGDTGGHPVRRLPDDTYRARIELDVAPLSMAPGEIRQLLPRFSNDGTARWPWGADVDPLIRPACRWYAEDDVTPIEGERSPFTADVPPGTTTVSPVTVTAPTLPGRYELELDLVHEHVRWFGCGLRVPVKVSETPADAHAPRLQPSPPALGEQRIPRILHRVWLGDAPVPVEHERYWEAFAALNPGWELRTWRDEALELFGIGELLRRRARSLAELANLTRYEVLRRHGGVYVDTDVEPLRPLDEILGGIEAFAGLELPGRVCNAVLGGIPGHTAFERAARVARTTIGLGPNSATANGPYLMSLICEQEPSVHIFDQGTFYPYLWDEEERRGEAFPDAYLVHHWAKSSWQVA